VPRSDFSSAAYELACIITGSGAWWRRRCRAACCGRCVAATQREPFLACCLNARIVIGNAGTITELAIEHFRPFPIAHANCPTAFVNAMLVVLAFSCEMRETTRPIRIVFSAREGDDADPFLLEFVIAWNVSDCCSLSAWQCQRRQPPILRDSYRRASVRTSRPRDLIAAISALKINSACVAVRRVIHIARFVEASRRMQDRRRSFFDVVIAVAFRINTIKQAMR
jgi:hypothetical protein